MGFENPFNFLLEKLKELCLVMLHPLINLIQVIKQSVVTGFEAVINFPAEKLRQLWFMMVHMWDPLVNFLNVIWQRVAMGFDAAINFPAEKLRELWSTTMVHVWDPFVCWLQKAFSPETWDDRIHEWLQLSKKLVLMGLENTWYPFMTWFDKVFPPEARVERLHHWFQVALPFVAVAVVAFLVYYFIRYCCSLCALIIKTVRQCFSCCFCYGLLAVKNICRYCMYCCKGGGKMAVKMMKAPGRNCMMPRGVFVADPKGYFRTLRGRP